jgi:hypothetical protein
LAGVIAAAALLAASVAWASHDAACQLLSTSAQRAGTRGCNPRQECINNIPGNVQGVARNGAVATCNTTMPTSGTCPTTETYNPRQECVAKLPPTPAVSIASVDGGAAGGNKTYAGRPDVMRVQGANVGMPGNTAVAVGEAGIVVGLVVAPNCAPPNCIGLAVQSAPNVWGKKRFQLRAWHGHSQVEGTVQVEAAPAPQAPALPQVATPKMPAPARPQIATPALPNPSVAVTPAAPGPIPVPYPVLPAVPGVPGVAVPQPSPACTGNPAQVADCQAKLAAYQGYMANLGRDVTLYSLPALYVDLLRPLYPNVDLRTVKFGFSNRQQANNATTDCSRIYFNGQDYVRKLATGALTRDENPSPLWLYHELRHTEQCVEWGGRDFFAARWFKDFQIGLIQTRLQRDPPAFMTEVHDRQPMEADANARMRQVEKALPDGLVAPGSAGRR